MCTQQPIPVYCINQGVYHVQDWTLMDVYLEDVYDIKCPRSRSNILSTRIPELLHGVQ